MLWFMLSKEVLGENLSRVEQKLDPQQQGKKSYRYVKVLMDGFV